MQAQVKPSLTDREKKIISNACDNLDIYYKTKNNATTFLIGGFIFVGGGGALIGNNRNVALTGIGIGGALSAIGWIIDRSASKHILRASKELRILSDTEENIHLPESIE